MTKNKIPKGIIIHSPIPPPIKLTFDKEYSIVSCKKVNDNHILKVRNDGGELSC